MIPVATSLPSLPPAPRFAPGGPGDVAAATRPEGTASPPASRAESSGTSPAQRDTTRPDGPGGEASRSPAASGAVSAEDRRLLTELKARDREVRAHENAHRAAGRDLVRGGSYDYQEGPDGKRYAIGGDVQIDTTPVADDPAATVEKMTQVIRAALAPAEPSPTDRAVAAQAAAERNRAQSEASADDGGSNDPAHTGQKGPTDAASAYRLAAESETTGARLDAIA